MASDVISQLDKKGRLPPIKLEVFPLDGSEPQTLGRFNSYAFNSNILIPVDTFCFVFKPKPPPSLSYDKLIQEGDTVQLTVGDKPISTGYIDSIDIEVDVDGGTRISVNGRDLMGFLEDNDAVNPDASIVWTNATTLGDLLPKLIANTRIKGYGTRNLPIDVQSLFATMPGESKLAALQRFLDPINAVAWMSPEGFLRVGRPSFDSGSLGVLGIRQKGSKRTANVLGMRIHRAAGQIPNAVLSIWLGNEAVQTLSKSKVKLNSAEGPKRLYQAGHKIYRTIVTSAPDANDVKTGLSETQRLISQGSNYLGSLAAREMARENVNELIVTMSVVGHLNENGDPYAPDTCYDLVFDAAGLEKKMYLFGVEYTLSEDGAMTTNLSFCNLNTIVADGPV